MDVLIFCGQSNMQGSTGEKPTEPPVSGSLEYRYLTDELKPLAHPVGEDIGDGILYGAALKNGSLVPAFCREYAKKSGNVVAIHVARGNSRVDEWQKGTERFSVAVDKIRKGIAKAEEQGPVGKIFFIYLQGESDALNRTGTDRYCELLLRLKKDLLKEIRIDGFFLIRVGYFSRYASWMTAPEKEKKKDDEAIMRAQEKLVRAGEFRMLTRMLKKYSKMPEKLNPKEFGPHYNNEAMIEIGTAAGKKLSVYKRRYHV